jgi:hypothetical protein
MARSSALDHTRPSAHSEVDEVAAQIDAVDGLTLRNLSSSLRCIIRGAVLAVIVDPLARRSRVSHGRA